MHVSVNNVLSKISQKSYLFYSQSSFIIVSNINIGPVAEIILRGWPENKEKQIPHTEPARMHSIVAWTRNVIF